MKQEYHTNATTNVKQRMEIKTLKKDKTIKEIANDYRISTKTVKSGLHVKSLQMPCQDHIILIIRIVFCKINYLYVAIDRATRLLYYKLYNSKSSNNAVDFLENVNNIFPMKIDIILTDNGFEFTNKHIKSKRGECCKKEAKFTEKCIEKSIEHRTTFAISSTNQWDGRES